MNYPVKYLKELQYAMRRAGQNPTESEVQDMINKIDDGSSSLNFEVKYCSLYLHKFKLLQYLNKGLYHVYFLLSS